MPVFRLSHEPFFPPADYADSDGLLAIGGDLSEERILAAYSNGIYPWYTERSPILWWSPDPRLVLFPPELKVPRSLKQTIRKGVYKVTFDLAFEEVIRNCAEIHRNRQGATWITEDMIDAYIRLHESGFAHSVESWKKGELAGGLYGIALGRAFYGESMFFKRSDASKVAFVHLVEFLQREGYTIIDCQMTTKHLIRFGAREIPRALFLEYLDHAIDYPLAGAKWPSADL